MTDAIPAVPQPRVPVRGGGAFPVHRIYCVGRNFADHAREMGATPANAQPDRGAPMFFSKPADAIVVGDGDVPYPSSTNELHHEIEPVLALGRDAGGVVAAEDAMQLVFGYAVGLDLTRRDLQNLAKDRRWPWDAAKGFDHSAPISEIVPAAQAPGFGRAGLALSVNGDLRQRGTLDELIWNPAEILHELSKLYALKAGDLVFLGTPAGVGPLRPGDRFEARLDGVATLRGRIVAGAV
jgi:2-keto-4-pentenoate hydratase/2-oxohepta-3-ene-1,7-dioic acid hydratase in catechol pathway